MSSLILITLIVLAAGYFLGQQFGSLILRWLYRYCRQKSSCLVMDLYRYAES